MVLKFFHLVLKKHKKCFLKMCGNPGFWFVLCVPALHILPAQIPSGVELQRNLLHCLAFEFGNCFVVAIVRRAAAAVAKL